MNVRPTLQFRPGEVVDKRYEIRRHIGSGGLGAVYAAYHRVLGRDVAIKFIPLVIRGTATDPAELFQREAQLHAKIKHQNIVEALDGGILDKRHANEDPIGFIVMELVDGPSLREVLQKGPLDRGRALAALTQVARALIVIHEARFLHRDVKPENILCTSDWRIKLCDYSNARFSPHSKYKTLNPRPVGTLQYMPYEQLMNTGMDETVDTFALGVMAFELLTGRHPRSPATGALPTRAEVMKSFADHEPMPLLANEEVARHLPAELVAIIDRATREDPARRPQAVEMHAAFRGATAREREERARLKAASSSVGLQASPAPAPAAPKTAKGTIRMATVDPMPAGGLATEPIDMRHVLDERTPSAPISFEASPNGAPHASVIARPAVATPSRAIDPTPEPLASSPIREARNAGRRSYPRWVSIAALAGGFVLTGAICVALLSYAGLGPDSRSAGSSSANASGATSATVSAPDPTSTAAPPPAVAASVGPETSTSSAAQSATPISSAASTATPKSPGSAVIPARPSATGDTSPAPSASDDGPIRIFR